MTDWNWITKGGAAYRILSDNGNNDYPAFNINRASALVISENFTFVIPIFC